MPPKRTSTPVPIQIQAFRRTRRWPHWRWALAGAFVAVPLLWFMVKSPSEPAPQPSQQTSAAQADGPPWRQGNADARFTLVFYADLECPYCKEYSPRLLQWIGTQQDVNLQWHHLPLATHEPAASTEARLAECAGQADGHEAFWQAVTLVYAHTRSDGRGLPEGLRYDGLTPAIERCLASERPDAAIRQQAEEAMKGGVAATPSLRLLDRETGRSVVLQGPVEGDALLSAMDMLAAGPTPAEPASAKPAASAAP